MTYLTKPKHNTSSSTYCTWFSCPSPWHERLDHYRRLVSVTRADFIENVYNSDAAQRAIEAGYSKSGATQIALMAMYPDLEKIKMARPRAKANPNMDRETLRIIITVTPAEMAALDRKARGEGTSVNPYITAKVKALAAKLMRDATTGG